MEQSKNVNKFNTYKIKEENIEKMKIYIEKLKKQEKSNN